MSSDIGDDFSGESFAAKFTVSDVSRRLQTVGLESLDALHQVDDHTFSNQEGRAQSFGERLLASRDSGIPLVEVEAIERGNEVSDGIYDILGLRMGTPLILNATHSNGLESLDFRGHKQVRMNTVGLSLPGIHVIPLDGNYNPHISSFLSSGSYSGYEMEGQRNEFGGPITPSFGASYTYEDSYSSYGRGVKEMHKVLDLVEEALGKNPNISRLPSGLDIIEVEEAPRFRNGASPKEFADMVFVALNDREEATITIACEDFTLPSAIVLGGGTEIRGQHVPLITLFSSALEHFYDIQPTSWSTTRTPGFNAMEPFSESIVLYFGKEADEDADPFAPEQPITAGISDLPTVKEAQAEPASTISPEEADGAEEITDGLYYRGGTGNEVRIDPGTLNLDELPLVLAMAGWTTSFGFLEDDTVSLSLMDAGGSSGKSGIEVAMKLNIIDSETGALLPGFSLTEESGRIQIGYNGVPNLRFAEFVKALHGLSPFQF